MSSLETPANAARAASIAPSLFDAAILGSAAKDAFIKLDPRKLVRNPVIFVTEVVAALVTFLWVRELVNGGGNPFFSGQIAAWLWFTVLFATFAEAVAEGRGKAQAETLKKTKSEAVAKRLKTVGDRKSFVRTPALELKLGDHVIVEAGDLIPGDGEIVEGLASVNESAITGESAPVIRESGGDRSAVTGGTMVLSDWIIVKITAAPGSSFIDRMIALVEGAERQKTPNELALSILLSGMTLIFLIAVVTLFGLAGYSGTAVSVVVLVALLVTLIPTTIGGLLSAIGIAGMDRLIRFNVIATSGRAVEAAGDVDTLLLDKTGTITFGNRMATEFLPVPGVSATELAGAVLLASLADETAEGRSIVALATGQYSLSEPDLSQKSPNFVPFAAQTRISGVDLDGRVVRKGAVDSILKLTAMDMSAAPAAFRQAVEKVARTGGTPLGVCENGRLLGVVHLKDVVKPGIKERFAELRAMGIRTVMVTGDNPITAAAIASEAGVDDFLAEATPEDKLAYIRKEQTGGRLIAMCGDGTNDAPALAQGRCRRRHADGNASRARSRQHGRSRQQPDEAHRNRRHRQAVADDAWLAHDVFDRQRRRQVFRHSAGTLHRDVSRTRRAQRHAARLATIGHSLRRDLQCARHRGADSARLERRALPSGRGQRAAAPQPLHLWPRRADRAVHRHQADRPCRLHPASRLRISP